MRRIIIDVKAHGLQPVGLLQAVGLHCYPCFSGWGWALLTAGSYLPLASSAGTLVKNSLEAVMSYQAPSAKSIKARPVQLAVTPRAMLLAKRFSSGRAALTRTYLSVHTRFKASMCAQRSMSPSLDGNWPGQASAG